MKVRLIQIGKSRGVLLPASVLEQCGFGEQIDMRVENGAVVLAPVRGPRDGWDEAFARMASAGDDALLLPDDMNDAWTEEN